MVPMEASKACTWYVTSKFIILGEISCSAQNIYVEHRLYAVLHRRKFLYSIAFPCLVYADHIAKYSVFIADTKRLSRYNVL